METVVQTFADTQDGIPGARFVSRGGGLALPERDGRASLGQPAAAVVAVVFGTRGDIGRRRTDQEAQPHDPRAPDTAHLRACRALRRRRRGRFRRRQTLRSARRVGRRVVVVLFAGGPSPGRVVRVSAR